MYYLIFCDFSTVKFGINDLRDCVLEYADKFVQVSDDVFIAYYKEVTPFNDPCHIVSTLSESNLCDADSSFFFLPIQDGTEEYFPVLHRLSLELSL